jgi:putative transposase
VLAVSGHASRRIRILGATSHPAASRVAQAAGNLVMDLEDSGSRARLMIGDRDGQFPGLLGAVLKDAGIGVALSGVQMPGMNAFMQRWVLACRPDQGIASARPLRALPSPVPATGIAARLRVHRRDRLGGVLREYRDAA